MIPWMSKKINLLDLFPDKNVAEIDGIARVLHGHCEVMSRIYTRLERERPQIIDDLMKSRSMNVKVDSSKTTN